MGDAAAHQWNDAANRSSLHRPGLGRTLKSREVVRRDRVRVEAGHYTGRRAWLAAFCLSAPVYGTLTTILRSKLQQRGRLPSSSETSNHTMQPHRESFLCQTFLLVLATAGRLILFSLDLLAT